MAAPLDCISILAVGTVVTVSLAACAWKGRVSTRLDEQFANHKRDEQRKRLQVRNNFAASRRPCDRCRDPFRG